MIEYMIAISFTLVAHRQHTLIHDSGFRTAESPWSGRPGARPWCGRGDL